MVGGRADSATYVNMKEKASHGCGFHSIKKVLAEDVPEDELLAVVMALNSDPKVDGILVQLPLPDHVNQKRILEAISVEKDVDGFHPYNMGSLARIGEEIRQGGSENDFPDGTKFRSAVNSNARAHFCHLG